MYVCALSASASSIHIKRKKKVQSVVCYWRKENTKILNQRIKPYKPMMPMDRTISQTLKLDRIFLQHTRLAKYTCFSIHSSLYTYRCTINLFYNPLLLLPQSQSCASAFATGFGLGKRPTGCGFLQLVGHIGADRFEHDVGLLDLLLDVPF